MMSEAVLVCHQPTMQAITLGYVTDVIRAYPMQRMFAFIIHRMF